MGERPSIATGEEIWFKEAVARLARVRAERVKNGRPDWQPWPDADGKWANEPGFGKQ